MVRPPQGIQQEGAQLVVALREEVNEVALEMDVADRPVLPAVHWSPGIEDQPR